MVKSDNLFLIIGTNPMPNLIAIANRVKEDGKVFLITSRGNNKSFGTKALGKEIKTVINSKLPNIEVKLIIIDKGKKDSIIREVDQVLNDLKGISELNYTGGTKFMSTTLYTLFKDYMRKNNEKIILSYYENKEEKFITESNLNNKIEYKEILGNGSEFSTIFNIEDIINCHYIKKIEFGKEEANKFEVQYGRGLEQLEDKNQWIDELNNYFKSKDKEIALEFIKKYVSEEAYLNSKDKGKKKIFQFLREKSQEPYINTILEELKNEKSIDRFGWSVKPQKNKEDNSSKKEEAAEIDFIVQNKYKLTAISATICEEYHDCKNKLYEIIARASQLNGDQCHIVFICLYDSYKELENIVQDINFELKDNLTIIARDNYYNLKTVFKNIL